MRFFRIPAFTGIEVHRDDADRGSLRVVEGCVPHGPGGLRSGPVWETLATVSMVSTGDENHLSAMDDGKGNSVIFASRKNEVHDIKIVSTENTDLDSLGTEYGVVSESPYVNDDAMLAPVGNRLYSFGDGTAEAVMSGKGPVYRQDRGIAGEDYPVSPDTILYRQEWSRFPDCQFFVQGPKKTIFAAGNPKDPLVVYISEPAGMTQPIRDSPYSTELTGQEPGLTNDNVQHPYLGGGLHGENEGLSTVRILGSNATRISALSTRGDKIVVHTDKGCHILYAPTGDQASTGYRTEQVAATNTSAAVNAQTVAGDGGTQPFWLGFDGQIYKDEAAVRGAEDFKSYSDPQQASWKAKGKWEVEHPANLENSFATYDPQSGMYWVFIESTEQPLNVRRPLHGPGGLSACQPDHTGVCPTGCARLLSNVPVPVPAVNWFNANETRDESGIEYWDGSILPMSPDPNGFTFEALYAEPVLYYSRYTYDDPDTGERWVLQIEYNHDVRLWYHASATAEGKWILVGGYRWEMRRVGPPPWREGENLFPVGPYWQGISASPEDQYDGDAAGNAYFMAADGNGGICFMRGLYPTFTLPINGPTNLLGSQAQQAPANGPTGLTGSQAQQAPANGPTGLTGSQAQQAPANGPTNLTGAEAAQAPVNGPTGLNGAQAQQAPANGPTGLDGAQDTSGPCSDLDALTPTVFNSNYDGSVKDLTRRWMAPEITIGGVTLRSEHGVSDFGTDKSWEVVFETSGTINFGYTPCTDCNTVYYPIGSWTAAEMTLNSNWHIIIKSDGMGVCVGHGVMNMQVPANGPTGLTGSQQHVAHGPTNLQAVQPALAGDITRNFNFPSDDYLTAPLGIDQWTVSGDYEYCKVTDILSTAAYNEYRANRLTLSIAGTDLIEADRATEKIIAVNVGIYHSQLPLSFTINATQGGVTESISATWTKSYTTQPPAPQLNAQIITPATNKAHANGDPTRTFVKGTPAWYGNGEGGDPPQAGTIRQGELVSSDETGQAHYLLQYNFFEPTTIYRYEIFGLFMSGFPFWTEQGATFKLRYWGLDNAWHDVKSIFVNNQLLDLDEIATFTCTKVAIYAASFGDFGYSRIDYFKIHTDHQVAPVNGPTQMRATIPSGSAPGDTPARGPTYLNALQDYPLCVTNAGGGHDGTYEINRYSSIGAPAWQGPNGKYIFRDSDSLVWYLGGLGNIGAGVIDTGDSSDWPWECTWSTISVTTGDCT